VAQKIVFFHSPREDDRRPKNYFPFNRKKTGIMKSKTSIRILPDAKGNPIYVILPYTAYQSLLIRHSKPDSSKVNRPPLKLSETSSVPMEVLNRVREGRVTIIRAWREYLGLTQQQLATRLGVTQGAFALTEKRNNPRPTTLAKIARAMKIDISQLMPD
jgi:DNA-binding XRE family transcriptional regulator